MSNHPPGPGSCTVRPLTSGLNRIAIASPAPPVAPDDRVAAAWATLRAANPSLHDGPVLLVDPEPLTQGEFRCRIDTYRTLAAAAVLGRDIRALGVCGIVTALDARGEEHVLFGRRGSSVRMYPGHWENAPSGSVAPPGDAAELTLADLAEALADEGDEELGIDLRRAPAAAIALLDDPTAHSLDVVLEVRLGTPIDPRQGLCSLTADREYVDLAWLDRRNLSSWLIHAAAGVSPPTLALVQWWLTRPSAASSPTPGPSPAPSPPA